jgi:hypothetical protein
MQEVIGSIPFTSTIKSVVVSFLGRDEVMTLSCNEIVALVPDPIV